MRDIGEKVGNGGATSAGLLTADEFNSIPAEIMNAVLSAGIGLLASDRSQLAQAISFSSTAGNSLASSGTGQNYVLLAPAGQIAPRLVDGTSIRFNPHVSNLGFATANCYGSGAKPIKIEQGGHAIYSGQIKAGEDCNLVYRTADGGYWELVERYDSEYIANTYASAITTNTTANGIGVKFGRIIMNVGSILIPGTASKTLPIPYSSNADHIIAFAGSGGHTSSIKDFYAVKESDRTATQVTLKTLDSSASRVVSYLSIGK